MLRYTKLAWRAGVVVAIGVLVASCGTGSDVQSKSKTPFAGLPVHRLVFEGGHISVSLKDQDMRICSEDETESGDIQYDICSGTAGDGYVLDVFHAKPLPFGFGDHDLGAVMSAMKTQRTTISTESVTTEVSQSLIGQGVYLVLRDDNGRVQEEYWVFDRSSDAVISLVAPPATELSDDFREVADSIGLAGRNAD